MLISIGQLDHDGYVTTFQDGKCIIQNSKGTCIAKIPRNDKGLYKLIKDNGDEVNIVTESLTQDALHHHLGHVSPIAAKRLVNEELVTGIKLVGGKAEVTCDLCAYAKAT
jgi:hypothetical protein